MNLDYLHRKHQTYVNIRDGLTDPITRANVQRQIDDLENKILKHWEDEQIAKLNRQFRMPDGSSETESMVGGLSESSEVDHPAKKPRGRTAKSKTRSPVEQRDEEEL
jgi:hypothetical protein